jgi:hypothetical protein
MASERWWSSGRNTSGQGRDTDGVRAAVRVWCADGRRGGGVPEVWRAGAVAATPGGQGARVGAACAGRWSRAVSADSTAAEAVDADAVGGAPSGALTSGNQQKEGCL